jgi:serine protease
MSHHSNKKKLLLSSAIAMAFLAPGASFAAKPEPQERVVIKFKDSQAENGKSDLKKMGGVIKRLLDGHNAVAATLPKGKLNALLKNANVEFVEEDLKRYPISMTRSAPNSSDLKPADHGPAFQVEPYGVAMVQADQITGLIGQESKVCVIDSGYDLGHEDKPGLEVVSGTDDSGAGVWSEDGSGHGTHTSGTINALDNGVGVVGVFPGSEMHIVRVFGDNGLWAYSSDLVAALDDCVANGARVISMSLGAERPSLLENMAFRKAEKNGILSVAAAGNDGNNRMNYPASYESVMSVGALDDQMTIAGFSQQNTHVEIAAPGVSVLSTVPTGSEMDVTLEGVNVIPMDGFELPAAPITAALKECGLGASADDCVGGAVGQICLIQRGAYSFAQKALSCEAAGGVGAVVYNNVDGDLYGTLGGTQVGMPVVGASKAYGESLLDGDVVTLAFTPTHFDYAYFNGTSMATPHVAGVAALLFSHFPQCSGSDIRNAMNATALDLGKSGQDHAYGNGLVQAKDALDYLTVNGCAGK